MKKVMLTGKLSLKKETVAKLNDEQMNFLKGGATTATIASCQTCAGQNTCQVVVIHTTPVGCGIQASGATNCGYGG